MERILLSSPLKGNCIRELEKIYLGEKADIFVFPEGFLQTENLEEALAILGKKESLVITGLKDGRSGKRYETALIIDGGNIIGEYQKCILTKSEKERGKKAGSRIHCIDTRYGKIGIPICYEIHFPEVARVMALEGSVLLVNMIGTGMYHDLQYTQWTALARARAIENEVYVIGCSHYIGEIPIAYAFSPQGEPLICEKNHYGGIGIEIDLAESNKKRIGYLEDRIPGCFANLGK